MFIFLPRERDTLLLLRGRSRYPGVFLARDAVHYLRGHHSRSPCHLHHPHANLLLQFVLQGKVAKQKQRLC